MKYLNNMKIDSKIVEEFFEWLGNCINFSKDNLVLNCPLAKKNIEENALYKGRKSNPL